MKKIVVVVITVFTIVFFSITFSACSFEDIKNAVMDWVDDTVDSIIDSDSGESDSVDVQIVLSDSEVIF